MRSWVPVVALVAVLVFQMIGLQRQIGGLRTGLHREIGDLRDDMRSEMSDLRVELGQRITRLETLMEGCADPAPARPGGS